MDMPTTVAIINFGMLLVAAIQLYRQGQDMKDLAHLTSELEHRVHRLAIHLDQKIYRLERVRDLITVLMQGSVALRQGSRLLPDKLDTAVTRGMTLPELAALIATINDQRLRALHTELAGILDNAIWPFLWNQMGYDLGEADVLISQQATCTEKMHRRILELLEETTQIEENAEHK